MTIDDSPEADHDTTTLVKSIISRGTSVSGESKTTSKKSSVDSQLQVAEDAKEVEQEY